MCFSPEELKNNLRICFDNKIDKNIHAVVVVVNFIYKFGYCY